MASEHGIDDSRFEDLLTNVNTRKSRLLHYDQQGKGQQNRCGWHLDHGALTMVMAPMYLNDDGEELPITDSGLLIKTCTGATIQVNVPPDSIAVQLGEVVQIHSGGRLLATPHCVCATASDSTREQFVVFMDCSHDTPLTLPPHSLPNPLHTPFLPHGVPTLASRFRNGMAYADFAKRTYQSYAS